MADSFCCSLESVACSLEHDDGELLTDTKWGHLWSIPPGIPCDSSWADMVGKCGCGLCDKQQTLSWRILQSHSSPFPPHSCIDESLPSAENLILDCFAAKRNGLQVAVETASLLLDLSYIIEDQN